MLGAIIRLASAGSATLGINYLAFSKVIPTVAKIAVPRVLEGRQELLQDIISKLAEFLGEKLTHEEVIDLAQQTLYDTVKVLLGVVWCAGQVLAAKVALYDNKDTTMKLLGLSSGDSHALQPSNKESQEEV